MWLERPAPGARNLLLGLLSFLKGLVSSLQSGIIDSLLWWEAARYKQPRLLSFLLPLLLCLAWRRGLTNLLTLQAGV